MNWQDWLNPDNTGFNDWYRQIAQQGNLSPNPDDPRHFYDHRTAYQLGLMPDLSGHLDSRFKTWGHPNLIVDGTNTKTGLEATIWDHILNQIANQWVNRTTM